MFKKTGLNLTIGLFILILPLFLLFSNLYFFLSATFIEYQYRGKGKSYVNPSEAKERLALAKEIVNYLKSPSGSPKLKKNLEKRELAHLADVKALFNLAFTVQKILAAAFFFLLIILSLNQESRKKLPLYLLAASLFTLLLLGGITFLAIVNFGEFFDQFHRLFFTGNSWLFRPDSLLIQLFPEEFWSSAAKQLLLFTMGEALLLAVGSYIYRRLHS